MMFGCKEFKRFLLFENYKFPICKQYANAWHKLKKHCDSCSVTWRLGIGPRMLRQRSIRWIVTLNSWIMIRVNKENMSFAIYYCHNQILRMNSCAKRATDSITLKMHCDICNCHVMPLSWCGHLKSRKHLNNMTS